MNIERARKLAELGDVDGARQVIADSPPGPVIIIEIPMSTPTFRRRRR